MSLQSASVQPTAAVEIKKWFDDLLDQLQVDQLMMETKTAPNAKKNIYDTFIFGKELDWVTLTRNLATFKLIDLVVRDYFKELKKAKVIPLKLAFNFSYSNVFVWAEIQDEDEKMEDALLIVEAKVNAKNYQHGFTVSSTIVEKSDRLSVPSHYKSVKFSK